MHNAQCTMHNWGRVRMAENVIMEKSKSFAIRVVRLYQYLTDNKKEYVLSKQLLRSGTSIGANVREANRAQSGKDFTSKMNIALKEAAESEYWLELLHETGYLSDNAFSSIMNDCGELNRLLISIVKSSNRG